jgi:hypothetical protein
MLRKDDGECSLTLEEWRVATHGATRNLTDDSIGAHMRHRVRRSALPEEPHRLRNVPVDGERTPGEAYATRATRKAGAAKQALEAAEQKRKAAKRRLSLVDDPGFDWVLADELDALAS